ncbi:hypothetical protein OIO90_005693 [Microbotryomycetes sp. JL221]|nr:hypothetical protein OIO90_005693 [Microbotryomycetes sp. JL221]
MLDSATKRQATTTDDVIKHVTRWSRIVQSGSAVLFSTFVVVHLSSPIAAAFARHDVVTRASDVMLLGRDYYQDDMGGVKEVVIVYLSAMTHVASGILRRILNTVERRRLRMRLNELANVTDATSVLPDLIDDEPLPLDTTVATSSSSTSSGQSQSPPPPPATLSSTLRSIWSSIPTMTLHHKTGYSLIPLMVHHNYIHRLLPNQLSLTPFLNWNFVSYSLTFRGTKVRIAQTLSYVGLVGLIGYHGIVGSRVIASRSKSPKSLKQSRTSQSKKIFKDSSGNRISSGSSGMNEIDSGLSAWQIGYATLVATVGVGLLRVGMTTNLGSHGPPWLQVKFDTVLLRGWKLLT